MSATTVDRQIVARCDRVTRAFGTGARVVFAVREATCQLHAGERVAVVGPSGSGKSTLLHPLAGLDRPTAGAIEWPALGGRASLRPGPVGVVFQGPSLLPPLDVVENVAVPLQLAGIPEAEAIARADHALGRLGLDNLASKLPEELSGGQAQRVAVARVLAGWPRLILADEPTGQLDRATGAEVVQALLEAAGTLGAALVMATHDPAVAELFPLRWEMADGELRGQGEGGLGCSA
jgi:ABC-type lipoprotein export system ATPase subunit